jgi:hypothetical protein
MTDPMHQSPISDLAQPSPARAIALALLGSVFLTSHALPATTTVLLEAESFNTPGGWRADTQSVEQMGSVYLLAHGLGQPVVAATTSVTLPAPATYRVWVRTRNWVPGAWEAPGRFKVAVNGAALAPVFGTASAAWDWQDGGTVAVTTPATTVTLTDLTGFNARCDAIAFVAGSDDPPPNEPAALKAWRRMVKNEAASPADVRQFDCVIAGGGMAGCCAAIAAARSGVRVALIHDRPVLGGNASQEIRVATRGQIRHAIVDEIDTLPLGNRDNGTVSADANRLAVIQRESNITLFMPWRAEDAGTDPATRRITHVDARHTLSHQRVRLQAPLFIDCTGDAWLGYWAGADYRMGTESSAEFGESLGKPTATAMTMGNSLMWKTKTGTVNSAFPAVPWAMDVAGTAAATGGDWNWEYGMQKNTIQDAEAIRDHLLRAIYGNFANAMKLAANAKLELDWVPFIAGKRESRRLMGDHIVTQQDMTGGAYFEDAVGTTDWGIDLHFETATSYLSGYAKTNIASPCYFPFRSLYSRNIPNLMMAGRNFSCTHVGLGSPRVMNTTGQMGVATGYAAAICKQYSITPRDLYRSPDRTLELQARITGTWPARPPAGGPTVDNAAATGVTITGAWTSSKYDAGFHGTDYLHDGNALKGQKSVTFRPVLPAAGSYEIFLKWPAAANRATNTPVSIATKAGVAPQTRTVNQQLNGGQWFSLGIHDCDPATAAVTLATTGTDGYVIADAVMFSSPAATSDLDSDQLPDWWERWHFLSETAANPAADSDSDGRSNLIEYLTGCDPCCGASRFDARLAIDEQAGGCGLRWPSTAGRTYRIEASPDCKSWQTLLANIPATPPENHHSAPVTATTRFFRVLLEP